MASESYNSEWESNPEPRPLFQEVLRCFPIKQYKNPHLEIGDKIILPPSSFSQILVKRLKYPLIFKLRTFKSESISYCGVLEFAAEEGSVYLPDWMMKNLNILDGENIVVSDASSVLKGAYMKLRPHTKAFAELADPRAVLEKVLREFTCLGSGSTIVIKYNRVDFYFDVLEVNPGDVISLIDTDCEVEFAPALDCVEPRSDGCGGSIEKVEEEEEGMECRSFVGKGRRLDGNVALAYGRRLDGNVAVAAAVERLSKLVIKEEKKSGKEFKPFTGKSRVLRSVQRF